jgi:hypothetical protein
MGLRICLFDSQHIYDDGLRWFIYGKLDALESAFKI